MAETALPTLSASTPKQRPHRDDLKPGEVLCSHCPAKCCHYLAVSIDEPETWEEFDYIRWYLLHERAAVFVEEGQWYLLVLNKCMYLRDDYLCGIYEKRPQICRDYKTDNCEYDDSWVYDQYWETVEQVDEYAEAVLGPRPGSTFRGPKPG